MAKPMAVNVIRTALAAIGVMYVIRRLGDIMATQEQLLAEVSDLRDAFDAISNYITEQDNLVQELRDQLEEANANSPSEVDLSPLVAIVDEIQTRRNQLAPVIADVPQTGSALDPEPIETPAEEEDSSSTGGEVYEEPNA